ncbi:aspartic protease 2B, partial [Aphelenchoides avenae]
RITFGSVSEGPVGGDVWRADFGFDATALFGPQNVTDVLAKEVGAKDDGYGFYKIACNATVPPLFLTFDGNQYEIPSSELVRPLSATDLNCIFNVYGHPSFVNVDFSLGAGLTRKYCLVLDYDDARLGFAPNRYNT